MPWTCSCGAAWMGHTRCHCARCHLTFSGLSTFDAHRLRGRCLDPAEVGLVLRDEDGCWAAPGTRPKAAPSRWVSAC